MRKLLAILLLAIGAPAFGQVAFDAATAGTAGEDQSSVSTSHTFTGANNAALVCVSWFTAAEISSLTVAGSSTGVTLSSSTDSSGDDRLRIRSYIVLGKSGTQTVTANFSVPVDNPAIQVVSLSGVNQSVPAGTPAPAQGSGTTPTTDVTSATGELVVDCVRGNTTLSVGAGQTSRVTSLEWSGSNAAAGMSTEPGAGSVTMSWTTTSTSWLTHAVSFKPAAGANTGIILKRRKH